MRADIFLVEQGYAKSRNEAQAAIRAGLVTACGTLLSKPSQAIPPGAAITYSKPHSFVSRAGDKLAATLDRFQLSPQERVCLDLGASTGGFTHVLLERGARRVYAVDVGHGQMDKELARDPRVCLREGLNARNLAASDLPEPVGALTADVSFIGLKLALPPALALVASGAWAVALVKPQFEVGKGAIGKGGIVRDATARDAAVKGIVDFVAAQPGWCVLGTMESPVPGGDGNIEYLLAASKA
ncbi:MAG TPA: TlyA family RNA methyltransferase [Rhizomicrobium sp.]|nr:TlyA family RNA methyltransferase [Rhizomicrobium sp.]